MMVLNKTQTSIDELNDTYYRMVDLIGLDDTVRLSEILEGKQIKFKKKYDLDYDFQDIVSCVGKAKADKIIKGFWGEWVYFSNIKKASKTRIRKEIHTEFNGYNYKQLAEKYGCTERNIRRIISQKV